MKKWAVYTRTMPNNEVWHQINKYNESLIKQLGGYDLKLFNTKSEAMREFKERTRWKTISLKWNI